MSVSLPIGREIFPTVALLHPNAHQRKPTEQEKQKDQIAFEKLDDIKKLAVRLRVNLLPYKRIVQRILEIHERQYTEQGIREWFIKNGPCDLAFQYWKRKSDAEAEENLKLVAPRIKYAAVDAIGLLTDGLLDNSISPEQIRVAQDILDRANFPKITKAESNIKVESDALEEMADAMREIVNDLKK